MGLSNERVRKHLSIILQVVGTILLFTGIIVIFYRTWYWGLLMILTGIFIVALSVIVDKRNQSPNR